MTMTKRKPEVFDREIASARAGEKRTADELAKLRAEHSWCIIKQGSVDRLVQAAEHAVRDDEITEFECGKRIAALRAALAPFRKGSGR